MFLKNLYTLFGKKYSKLYFDKPRIFFIRMNTEYRARFKPIGNGNVRRSFEEKVPIYFHCFLSLNFNSLVTVINLIAI